MGIKDRRRLIRVGNYSTSVILPANLEKGEEATLAANRLILMDPRGEIDEAHLLEFLEEIIEPKLWQWMASVRASKKELGGA